jgi:hypothetical protein
MALPTFLIVGAQKAATTSLHHYLSQHPDVFLPTLKEADYFIDEGNWSRGQGWYESLFEPGAARRHRGDASPSYTMYPFYRQVPERAAALVPDARVIYVLRHPVDRMVASWAQGVGAGIEDRDLTDAMLLASNYLLLSCYGLQMSRWLAHFDREQILVIRAEDLRSDPGTFDRVLAHLGLVAGWRASDQDDHKNPTLGRPVARAPVRRFAGVLRRGGFERAARSLGPGSRSLRRLGLTRPLVEADLALPDDVRAALLEALRADFALLREQVGDDLDLWGLA